MVSLDFRYVQHWSLFEDIEILVKSIQVGARGRFAVILTDDRDDFTQGGNEMGLGEAEEMG